MKKYIIIGTSAAGISAAAKLRQIDPLASIECITQESVFPYNKCFLADYFSGKKDERSLLLKNNEFFEKESIVVTKGVKVIELRKDVKQIVCDNGIVKQYDTLLVATGSSSFVPFDIQNKEGIFCFNTLDDVNAIVYYIKKKSVKSALIIGAGLSGLECADSLLSYGISLTVIEKQPFILSAVLHKKAALFLEEKIKKTSINLLCATSVLGIIYDQTGTACAVVTSSGETIHTDLIIIALGVRPNTNFLLDAGIALADNKAVLVNDYLQTSNPAIYAAGDIVMVKDKITGKIIKSSLWPDALQQGICAASNMAGISKVYEGVISSMSSAFFGLKFYSSGDIFNQNNQNYDYIERSTEDIYSYIALQQGIVKGFILLGNVGQEAVPLRRSLINQKPI